MNAAIITAAGKSTRLKGNVSKQFINIYGKPILVHTLTVFQNSPEIKEIYVTVPDNYLNFYNKKIIKKYSFDKVKKLIVGGSSRQESVYNALREIPSSCRIILIHDGVRPLITTSEVDLIINKLIQENKSDFKIKGLIMATPANETIKKVENDNIIKTTIPRSKVWYAQTPQAFFYKVILEAHRKALKDNFVGTDDSSLVERMGWKIKVLRGRHENIKITVPLDLFLAELVITKNNKK